MDPTTALDDAQCRLLAALKELADADRTSTPTSLRHVAGKYRVPRTTLQRARVRPASAAAVLAQSAGRGRKRRLHAAEEELIAGTILEFQSQGTPLTRDLVLDLTQTFVGTLPAHRRRTLQFRDNRPGYTWLRGFVTRFPYLTVKSTADLENERAQAMSPEHVAEHFARVRTVLDKYRITEPTHVFNLDECGFSVKGMTWGRRVKRVVHAGTTSFQRTLTWTGSVDHVTCMAVVSAAGKAWTPAFVLPGVLARYRRRQDGRWETPSDFLPKPNYLYQREVAGMDSDIFYSWAKAFVEETALLRTDGKYMLLVYDGYASHCTYRTLKLFQENNIVVVSLPAHTSHALQPLDVGVFSPLKNAFRSALNRRVVVAKRTTRNDIFTICELLQRAFHQAVTPSNIIAGFRGTGLWVQEQRGPHQSHIKPSQYTAPAAPSAIEALSHRTRSRQEDLRTLDEQVSRVETARQLYALFLSNAGTLLSDGTVVENGLVRVTTTRGATLTTDVVISAAKRVTDKKAAEARARAAKAIARDQRRLEKALEAAKKADEASRREEAALQKRKAQRASARAAAQASRFARRAAARQRHLSAAI